MSQQFLNGRNGTRRALEAPSYAPNRTGTNRNRERELESKLALMQQNYAELHTAIFEAAQVHRRLCAPRSLSYGNFEVASEIFAVRHLPGDFFTVISTGAEVVLALGDICGKGLAAGMWTTHLVGSVQRHAERVTEPAAIVAGVNRDLCRMASAMALATLFLARLDPISGRLDFCSAGHPAARLLRADGTLEDLSKGGMILGVAPQAVYTSGAVTLGERDTLLVYSDGVTESLNDQNEEFGRARLERELRRARNGRADAILFSVLGAVQDFAATRPLADDLSLVIVRRRP